MEDGRRPERPRPAGEGEGLISPASRAPRAAAAGAVGSVPMEFIGKARALRARIERDQDRFEAEAERIIYPLRPRPAWPAPTRRDYLAAVGGEYRLLHSPCRLECITKIDGGGRLVLFELRAAASRMTFAGWGEANEPSIRASLYVLKTPPFEERQGALAEVGLHAIARRFERGRPDDDRAVLKDLVALAWGFADAASGEASTTEFAIPAPSRGRWIGALAALDSESEPVMAVRTFVA